MMSTMRQLIAIFSVCLLACSVHVSGQQYDDDSGAPCVASDDETQLQINEVFPQPPEDDDDCVCVPYYLCLNNTVIDNGITLIDIRISPSADGSECSIASRGSCKDTMEVWCLTPNRVVPTKQCDGTGVAIPKPYQKQEGSGCGKRNVDGVGFRITGQSDNEAQFGEFPWMVAILVEASIKPDEPAVNVYQCGGSLIHPQVVLTSAHCVVNKDPNVFRVRAGEWDTQTTREVIHHQDRRIVEIVKHEHYYAGALYNDVALLFLDSPFKEDDNVGTICLPKQGELFDHAHCVASGWGKDVFGKDGLYQVILKSIDLPVVPSNVCQSSLRTTRLGAYFKLHNSFICAGGEEGKDVCKGDGGSPLACPLPDNHYVQSGIVAWGIGCGEHGIPGVYANVALFRDWIDQKMIDHGFNVDSYTRPNDFSELQRLGKGNRNIEKPKART